MRTKKILLLLSAVLLLASCISNKKIVYLQSQARDAKYHNENFTRQYKIKPHDLLSVQVTSLYPENNEILAQLIQQGTGNGNIGGGSGSGGYFYINGYAVDDSGQVKIPMIGEVPAAGKTIHEVEGEIEQKFNQYYDGITVVVKLGGIQVSMLGEFNRPGTINFFQPNVTILQAIARAGDFTELANRKEVLILRTQGNEIDRHTLDLTSDSLLESPYYYLQADDVIYAKPLKAQQYGISRNALQYTLTILSFISSTLLIISLVGGFSKK